MPQIASTTSVRESSVPETPRTGGGTTRVARRSGASSADAEVPLIFALPARRPRSRSRGVEYRQNFNGPGSDDTEQEIHLWLKNTGTVHANYYIHMSVIQE